MKISVIMGIYNCGATLPQAIDSILAQTETDWELILCDDGSGDDTYAVAERYREQYPEKIVLLKNEQNMGLHATLNRCLEAAKGEFIARMDGDDISMPERLAVQLQYLQENPDMALVGTSCTFFDENGTWGWGSARRQPTKEDIFYNRSFVHPTVMVRRSAYDAVGGYTVSRLTRRAEDYDLWCKLYEKGMQGYNLPEYLVAVRDDRDALKRRRFVHYWELSRLHWQWHRRLKTGSVLYCLRPLAVGLVPRPVMRLLRKKRYNK